MPTFANMEEERLGRIERGALRTNRRQSSRDHFGASRLTTAQNQPDLGKAHAHTLTGQHGPASAQLLVRIVPVPARGPVRHDDALVLPVPEHMRGHSQLCGRIPDLHQSMMTP